MVETSIARQQGREEEATEAFNQVFRDFASNCRQEVASDHPATIQVAARLHETLREYAFDCSLEVFGYIGKGYASNPEFKANIDRFGVGVADYASQAIACYVEQESQ